MDLSAAGAAFVRGHEGVVTHYYLDASTPPVGTIGIGFTWASGAFRTWWAKNKPGVKFGPGATMTRAEADQALIYIVAQEYGAAVNRFLGKDVAQHVYDGTTSPVFNLGPGSLDWKWAAAVKRGDYAQAAELLRSTGTTAGGKVLRGLVARRAEEADLIQLGDYTIGSKPVPAMADGMLIRGERGPEVEKLQRDLAALGIYSGVVDGIFGYGTEAAVLAFQRAHGLKADGWAGTKTLATIASSPLTDIDHYPEPASPPTRPPPRPSIPVIDNPSPPHRWVIPGWLWAIFIIIGLALLAGYFITN